MALPSSLSSKIGPFPLWVYLLGLGVITLTKKHWLVGGIGGAGVQGYNPVILGGGIGGYGDEGYGYYCSDDGYCGGGGGDQGGGGPGGGGHGPMGPGGGGGQHKRGKGSQHW